MRLPEPAARAIAEAWANDRNAGRELHKAIHTAGVAQGRVFPDSEPMNWTRVSDVDRDLDRRAAIELVTAFLTNWFHNG
jgi:hypothetical protein